MLHQTQVQTVTPYYGRFLRAFPTVRRLAAAPLDEVLRLWAGLGYYSRACNLHAAAQVIVAQHRGRFPSSPEAVAALPGIGRYTAGAILSIAFGVRLPAIDGNAARVLARVFLVRSDVQAGRPRQRIGALGQAAVPEDRPGDYNQALMELGSLVCTPRNPRCDECCLADICRARARGRQAAIPSPRRRAPVERVRVAAGMVSRNGRVLIAQRPAGGVWGGLWEFPNVAPEAGEEAEAALRRVLRSDFGLVVEVGRQIASLRHGIMNRSIDLTAYACTVIHGRTSSAGHAAVVWTKPEDLADYAMPAPHRKVADHLIPAP